MSTVQTVSMDGFIKGLAEISPAEFSIQRVAEYLRWKEITKESLQPYTYFEKDHYTRNLIYKNDLFEVIAFGWDVGQKAPVHSHNRQLCWMSVQVGKLFITNYRMIGSKIDPSILAPEESSPENSIELEKTAAFVMETVGVITWADEKMEIHSVENTPDFQERAVSVHVYSRPFGSCIVYDLDQKRCQRVSLSYYSMHGKKC